MYLIKSLSDVRESDDRVREMKNLQILCNNSEGKLMLEQRLGRNQDVKLVTEVLDNMIRDEEKGEDQNF